MKKVVGVSMLLCALAFAMHSVRARAEGCSGRDDCGGGDGSGGVGGPTGNSCYLGDSCCYTPAKGQYCKEGSCAAGVCRDWQQFSAQCETYAYTATSNGGMDPLSCFGSPPCLVAWSGYTNLGCHRETGWVPSEWFPHDECKNDSQFGHYCTWVTGNPFIMWAGPSR